MLFNPPTKKGSKILVTGTIAFDHLFTYDSSFLEQLRAATMLDVLSVSFQPHNYVKRYGGTGANIAWNIALLGGHPLLIGKVGPDGQEYIDLLKKRGIDTSAIETISSSMTSTGVCCTDAHEHQIWFFYRGADAIGHWPEIDTEKDDISYAIIGPRNPEKMMEGLEWCVAKHIPRLFDPGQYILDFSVEDLSRAIKMSTGVIMNAFESGTLQQRLGWTEEETAKHVEYLIVTHGEDGHVIYYEGKKESFHRCNCDNPVNPTGAGDAFRAGLITGLTSGWTLAQSSKLGAAIASFIVEQEGALMEKLDVECLKQRVKDAYGETLPPLPLG